MYVYIYIHIIYTFVQMYYVVYDHEPISRDWRQQRLDWNPLCKTVIFKASRPRGQGFQVATAAPVVVGDVKLVHFRPTFRWRCQSTPGSSAEALHNIAQTAICALARSGQESPRHRTMTQFEHAETQRSHLTILGACLFCSFHSLLGSLLFLICVGIVVDDDDDDDDDDTMMNPVMTPQLS